MARRGKRADAHMGASISSCAMRCQKAPGKFLTANESRERNNVERPDYFASTPAQGAIAIRKKVCYTTLHD